jgi:DNA-binding phage protein
VAHYSQNVPLTRRDQSMQVGLNTRNIRNARFVRDQISRLLALSGALVSEHGEAISAVFLEIARARGIAEIALEAGLTEDAIYAAMTDAANRDTVTLRQVVNSMLRIFHGTTRKSTNEQQISLPPYSPRSGVGHLVFGRSREARLARCGTSRIKVVSGGSPTMSYSGTRAMFVAFSMLLYRGLCQ